MNIMHYHLEIIVFGFLCMHINLCYGKNWHFSLSSMYDLLNLEVDHLTIMTETYIRNEYKRLDDIKRFIEQREIENAKQVAESYTDSSINAFKTILRIKNDWETLSIKMTQSKPMDEFKQGLVTKDNVMSALKALRRLQIVYELEVHEITNGELNGYTFEKLNVDDCYQMASMCYDNAEFHCANQWFEEVYKKYDEDSMSTIDYGTLVIKYIWSSYLVGDFNKSQTIITDYLKNGDRLTGEMMNLRYIVWTGDKVFKRNTADDYDKKYYSHSLRNLDSSGEVRSFITACQDWNPSNYLTCSYYHGMDPFLIIAPLREESITIIPNINMYHGILYDDEIMKIKTLAKPKLEILSIDTNEDISLRKVATFRNHNDRVFGGIENKLARISSKFRLNIVDKYVVTNYGLNGHYLPHKKYIDNDHLINTNGYQAMVIFQLNDKTEGGHTVIPELHVRIPHVKGSALIVKNSQNIRTPFGMMFKYTQYGSCPIFYGDKWTLTAWIGDKNNL